MSSDETKAPVVPSEKIISVTIQEGLRNVIIDSGVGLIVGGLIGIVLARGGGTSSLRKSCAGFGAGIGAGSAWTRTSINLEDTLETFATKARSAATTTSSSSKGTVPVVVTSDNTTISK